MRCGACALSHCSPDDARGGFADKLIHELGGESKHKVAEIYSPARVTDMARRRPKLGIAPGFAMDITTCDEEGIPWDFTVAERRDFRFAICDLRFAIATPPPGVLLNIRVNGKCQIWACRVQMCRISADSLEALGSRCPR